VQQAWAPAALRSVFVQGSWFRPGVEGLGFRLPAPAKGAGGWCLCCLICVGCRVQDVGCFGRVQGVGGVGVEGRGLCAVCVREREASEQCVGREVMHKNTHKHTHTHTHKHTHTYTHTRVVAKEARRDSSSVQICA
jgi:hypothetical protein